MRYFIDQHPEIDIFGFTEVTDISEVELEDKSSLCYHASPDKDPVRVNALSRLREMLDETHDPWFTDSYTASWRCSKKRIEYPNVAFGSAIFWRKDIRETMRHSASFAASRDTTGRVLQSILFERDGITHLFMHMHGVWIRGNTKGDDPIRNQQSEFILQEIRKIRREREVDKIIFGGDLNLDLNTEALDMLERGSPGVPKLQNLIREYGIASTRTSEFRKYAHPGESMYADYALVSENVLVENFIVDTNTLASDHAPLILTFS